MAIISKRAQEFPHRDRSSYRIRKAFVETHPHTPQSFFVSFTIPLSCARPFLRIVSITTITNLLLIDNDSSEKVPFRLRQNGRRGTRVNDGLAAFFRLCCFGGCWLDSILRIAALLETRLAFFRETAGEFFAEFLV